MQKSGRQGRISCHIAGKSSQAPSSHGKIYFFWIGNESRRRIYRCQSHVPQWEANCATHRSSKQARSGHGENAFRISRAVSLRRQSVCSGVRACAPAEVRGPTVLGPWPPHPFEKLRPRRCARRSSRRANYISRHGRPAPQLCALAAHLNSDANALPPSKARRPCREMERHVKHNDWELRRKKKYAKLRRLKARRLPAAQLRTEGPVARGGQQLGWELDYRVSPNRIDNRVDETQIIEFSN